MTDILMLSTWSFGQRANAAAWPALACGGAALDAVVAACAEAEADPAVDSVGFGGLPDRDGSMSFDACVMCSPRERGGVCAMRRTRHPARVARLVMERTPHVLLAGASAERFAEAQGIALEDPDALLAPEARAAWEQWRADPRPVDQSRDAARARPVDGDGSGRLFGANNSDPEARWRHHDTLGVLALDRHGTLAGACTTSGTPYKVPGRVGDSPIVGHGLYVDPQAGAAVATGTGELMMGVCTAFFVTERLREGATPADAIRAALDRLVATYELTEADQCGVIALTPDGRWSTGALRAGYRTAVRTADRAEMVEPEVIRLS